MVAPFVTSHRAAILQQPCASTHFSSAIMCRPDFVSESHRMHIGRISVEPPDVVSVSCQEKKPVRVSRQEPPTR